MNKTEPAEFERRILLLVAGATPAIVTETVYALTQKTHPPYFPTEIHIITTAGVYSRLADALLGESSQLHALCREYGFAVPVFHAEHITCIADKSGHTLQDITTEADNEVAANFITHTVRMFTHDPHASLHVSIAGGRKTMSYYIGYAMSVFGRIQDRMSHVLVEDKYLNPKFYYPTVNSYWIEDTRNPARSFDACDVNVMLGELPFIRLRDGLADDLLNDTEKNYSDIIKIAQQQLSPVNVVVSAGEAPVVWCGGKRLELETAELAQYVWLLKRNLDGAKEGVSLTTTTQKKLHFEAYFSIYKKLSNESEHYQQSYARGVDVFVKGFRERNSRIKKKLETLLGKPRAKNYIVQNVRINNTNFYALSSVLSSLTVEFQLSGW